MSQTRPQDYSKKSVPNACIGHLFALSPLHVYSSAKIPTILGSDTCSHSQYRHLRSHALNEVNYFKRKFIVSTMFRTQNLTPARKRIWAVLGGVVVCGSVAKVREKEVIQIEFQHPFL